MQEKCVVPNCKNISATTGIAFPEQEELKTKWLDSLGIPGFQPKPTNFVCLDHFNNDNFFLENSLQNSLEELPIPTVNPRNEPKSSTEEICRLCSSEIHSSSTKKSIFDAFNKEMDVAGAINECIPRIPLPNKEDGLPQAVCNDCFVKLTSFHNFQNVCLQSNVAQRLEMSSNRKALKRKREDTDQDAKFNQVEAHLMEVLKDNLPDDIKSAENIIIQVQSDEDDDDEEEAAQTEEPNKKNVVTIGNQQLILPNDLKISVNHAKIGKCSATHISGLYKTEFCIADNYLFEYRLQKGDLKHLKCVMPRCRASAEQKIVDNELDSFVTVKTSHNHPPPNDDEMKKSMYLQIMRRKMQSDKSLPFRQVYEEVCTADPDIKEIIPLRQVINVICGTPSQSSKVPTIRTFLQFYNMIEGEDMQKLHFTQNNTQFYQERFCVDDALAVVFANREKLDEIGDSKIMYVDASFKIETKEPFEYFLVTVLVWVVDSFYPVMFALVSSRSQEIYRTIFKYLHESLAPNLRPDEIVTDYEAALYYSLAEIYLESHIGGSVFYYAQNLYKKICSLNLSHQLESNSCFRNIYHMILMLPLLPVNTILDGLNNIELQANEMNLKETTQPIFDYVKEQWMQKVTPELFCVHRLENRIKENVIAPFKKLRDFLLLSKGKVQNQQTNIVVVVEKLIELEGFLQGVYAAPSKKSFSRDLSSSQKKNVIKAWQFIESHPKININYFFTKVLGYIKCMENQLWIWGFYRYGGGADDELINAANFSIVNTNEEDAGIASNGDATFVEYIYEDGEDEEAAANNVVMDVVIDEKDGYLVNVKQQENFEAKYAVEEL